MEANRILLVEDDKEIREGVEIFLKSQNYIVFQAADGIEGLEIMEREEIHLAIVDVMMPRMDGITMVVRLREKWDIPVIFLSAKSEEVDKIMGLNMGADDYITKPFTPMNYLQELDPSSAAINGLWTDWRKKSRRIPKFTADWRPGSQRRDGRSPGRRKSCG